jgi:hypothetical protein
MKRYPILAAALIPFMLVLSGPLFGQVEDFYFSHWNTGLDARSLAMGKTGLALIDDSMATALNPAGLVGVTTIEFGLAGSYNHFLQDAEQYTIISRPHGFDTETNFLPIIRKSLGFSPEFAALSLPLRLAGRPLVLQVSFQRRIPFSFDSESRTSFDYQTRYHLTYSEKIQTEGHKGLDRLSLSAAFQPVKGIALGLTVSRWTGGARLPTTRTISYKAEGLYGLDGEWDEVYVNDLEYRISGTSMDAGIRIFLGDRFCLGFLYRLGWKADLDYANTASYTDGLTGYTTSGAASGLGTAAMPSAVGVGLSFRILKDLLLAVDYSRTFWSNRTLSGYSPADASGYAEVGREYLFPSMSPVITGAQTDSHFFGVGVEFLHETKSVNLFYRQGFFLESQHLFEDFGRQKRFWGLSIGPGVQMAHFVFNLAAALTFGSHIYARDRVSDAPAGAKILKSTLLTLRSSLTFRF